MYINAVVSEHVPQKQEKYLPDPIHPKIVYKYTGLQIYCISLWSIQNAPEASKFTVPELVFFFTYHSLGVFETTLTATQQIIIIIIICIDKNGT